MRWIRAGSIAERDSLLKAKLEPSANTLLGRSLNPLLRRMIHSRYANQRGSDILNAESGFTWTATSS